MSLRRILVIDDEEDIRGLLRDLLVRAGFEVSVAADGRSGLRELHSVRPDLVVLDVMMPGLDGWQTLERIRELTDVPVLMLTARTAELEKVRGLKAGADDYVGKPFGGQELLARVEVLLRRSGERGGERELYADGLLHIDFARCLVMLQDQEIALTPLEFGLLSAFVHHPNQVLSQEQLLELVWRDPFAVFPEQVKLHVGRLRRKLGASSPERSPIETVRGFGYRYRPPAV